MNLSDYLGMYDVSIFFSNQLLITLWSTVIYKTQTVLKHPNNKCFSDQIGRYAVVGPGKEGEVIRCRVGGSSYGKTSPRLISQMKTEEETIVNLEKLICEKRVQNFKQT